MTCRFTTVLQYSTRDVQHAFERLGWETKLIIEPSPYHRVTYLGLRQALLDFKPDAVFCIDHLRYETKDLYPQNLPFICWIQDNLPNLTSVHAGRSIGPRDFVLTANRPTYSGLHAYPQRQCIDMGKLTRLPTRPAQWTSDGDDLAYVSNAARPGDELADALVDQAAPDEQTQRLVRICCDRMLDIYRHGDWIDTTYQILELVRSVQCQLAMAQYDTAARHRIVSRLVHPFHDALYRQQGLRWAAAVADRLGLTLAIYGNGWDVHPRFAAYARGPVTYGPALEELTRKTKMNLRLEPYTSLSHQRLADGLVAGGFYLHRLNRAETELQALANFMHEHLDLAVGNLLEARAGIGREYRDAFEQLVDRCMKIYHIEDFDPIEGVRISQAEGALAQSGQPLPSLSAISFDSQAQLEQQVKRFLENPAMRRDIADRQRAAVEAKLTYEAGMRRTVEQIRHQIAAETATDTQDQPTPTPIKKSA